MTAPDPCAAKEVGWVYRSLGSEWGPVDWHELVAFHAAGQLTDDDVVRPVHDLRWQRLGDLLPRQAVRVSPPVRTASPSLSPGPVPAVPAPRAAPPPSPSRIPSPPQSPARNPASSASPTRVKPERRTPPARLTGVWCALLAWSFLLLGALAWDASARERQLQRFPLPRSVRELPDKRWNVPGVGAFEPRTAVVAWINMAAAALAAAALGRTWIVRSANPQ